MPRRWRPRLHTRGRRGTRASRVGPTVACHSYRRLRAEVEVRTQVWSRPADHSIADRRRRVRAASIKSGKDHAKMARTTRKILLSALVLALFGSIAGFGVFSAFSVTTVNSGNSFAAGTVTIGDNDAGSALYNVSNRKPGDTVTSCIRVTYSGTLASDVKLYTADPIGAIGPYVNLTIDPG